MPPRDPNQLPTAETRSTARIALEVLPEPMFLLLVAWRIARRRVLTRRMPAIETLGAATVLCVDKTGTLTEKRMQVVDTIAPGAAAAVGVRPRAEAHGARTRRALRRSPRMGAGGAPCFRAGMISPTENNRAANRGARPVDLDAVERVYRRYAPAYDFYFGTLFQDGRREVIQRMGCRPGERILEVGVGTGLSLPLYPDGVSVTGIDISREMLARAQARKLRRRLDQVTLHCMDAEQMTFATGSFDKVVAMYVASVAPNPVRLVDEMRRVCRPGGELYIVNHFMRGNLPMNGFKRFMGKFAKDLGFRMDFSLEDFVRDARLDVIEYIPVNLFGFWTLLRASGERNAQPEETGSVQVAR